MRGHEQDRARVNLVDVIMGFLVLVALMVLAPFFYKFIAMVSGEADPLSALLLQLFVPFLFIALIVSLGVSARGGT